MTGASQQIVATATRLNLMRFPDHTWVGDIDEYVAKSEQVSALNRMRASAGTVSFASLLESECMKALAQGDRRRLRGALINLAAMAMRRAAELDLALEGELDGILPTTVERAVAMDAPGGS